MSFPLQSPHDQQNQDDDYDDDQQRYAVHQGTKKLAQPNARLSAIVAG